MGFSQAVIELDRAAGCIRLSLSGLTGGEVARESNQRVSRCQAGMSRGVARVGLDGPLESILWLVRILRSFVGSRNGGQNLQVGCSA